MKKTSLYDSNHSPSKIRGGQGALITIICTMLLLLGACTRNHGDIGIWFGTWHIDSITVDDVPVQVEGDYFFQFQSTVFRVCRVYGHENLVESFGTWEEGDGKMTISFPDPDVFYIQMPGLEVHNNFTVATTSSREVIFSHITLAGTSVTYHLHKQP